MKKTLGCLEQVGYDTYCNLLDKVVKEIKEIEIKPEIDIQNLVEKYGDKIKFSAGIKRMITLEIVSNNERQILNDTTKLLKDLSAMGMAPNCTQ